MEATPLKDRQGRDLGQMLLLQDVTEQKMAHARLLEQERVVATLQERERLAREFHDGIGQVFGYLSMQAQTVRSRLRAGDGEKADALLARLVEVAQDAHADVRESILDLKAASSAQWSFIPTLDRYLRDLRTDHAIETELAIADPTRLEVPPDGHFGLAFMRERMAQIGGGVEIDSRQGAGTRVILEVPLDRQEGDGGESTPG